MIELIAGAGVAGLIGMRQGVLGSGHGMDDGDASAMEHMQDETAPAP